MLEELKNAENRVVGLKQLLRAVESGSVICVYIAEDADESVKNKILFTIGQQNINVVYVNSMKQLGVVCGIEVGAACAAIINN